MENRSVEWLHLPKELWLAITKHFTTTMDILRFRSVCNSWRSLLPLPDPSSHALFSPQLRIPLGEFCLLQTKLYRLQPSSPQEDPSISSKGWIIKIGESKSIPLRLLDPFTNQRASLSHTSPKVLNLMNFRVVELMEAYSLYVKSHLFEDEVEGGRHVFMPVPVRKAVLFENRMVFALQKDGKLGVSKIGDCYDENNWPIMEDDDDGNNDMHYDDMILHKGQLYVVDKYGTIMWVDCYSSSTLKLVQFSPMLCGFGKKKRLVECGGSLYVVDMYVEGEPDNNMGSYYEVVDVKVYRLDEEWGRWLDVKDLGDVLFVLGKDSNFSLSAKDYHGCEGNCIYLYSGGRVCGFSLGSSKFVSPNIFWPCPTLFHPKFNF